jgi:hypothetical protein
LPHAATPGRLSNAEQSLCKAPTGKLCRVFISHAGEPNMGFVDYLQQGFEVQYPSLNFFVGKGSQGVETAGALTGASGPALEDAFVGKQCPPYQVCPL